MHALSEYEVTTSLFPHIQSIIKTLRFHKKLLREIFRFFVISSFNLQKNIVQEACCIVARNNLNGWSA
jgi:hypothetical protein